MLEIKLILCPIDFSEFSIQAYHHARSVAEHYRSKLVALNIVELSRFPYADYVASTGDYEAFSQSLREGDKEQLQEFVKHHTRDGMQPKTAVLQGTAPDCILSFAQTRKADLIVMGTHGRRVYDRLVISSVTNRVMRKAPCPVLAILNRSPILRPQKWPPAKNEHHARHLSRILFCTDFSANSERALDYATSATAEYAAELTLLHVLEEIPSAAKRGEAIATAMAHLDRLIAREERKALKLKTAVRVGKPYQQIIQLALEARIDMVVIAVRGGGALDLAVFGSTTYRVLQLGSCPVLAVHI